MKQRRMEPLKPCPFCGGNARLEEMAYPHRVYCIHCGASVTGTGFWKEGEADAARRWNARETTEKSEE